MSRSTIPKPTAVLTHDAVGAFLSNGRRTRRLIWCVSVLRYIAEYGISSTSRCRPQCLHSHNPLKPPRLLQPVNMARLLSSLVTALQPPANPDHCIAAGNPCNVHRVASTSRPSNDAFTTIAAQVDLPFHQTRVLANLDLLQRHQREVALDASLPLLPLSPTRSQEEREHDCLLQSLVPAFMHPPAIRPSQTASVAPATRSARVKRTRAVPRRTHTASSLPGTFVFYTPPNYD
ncbi:hypothetical protein C8R45DRAFT_1113345 [Mycena sanguinolenta]|nr:hypothetical protein C8R45DRAFT_1113345 [Mycena sanguinolenta]